MKKTLPQVDFITYGFPCQDISLAGKQQGLFNDDGTKTRSGLFFDALRVIKHCKPKVAIAENVKNLTSKKFAKQFKIVLDSLENVGYNNYWKILNAKDFGIPQNRERVFIVSIRKDCDTGAFEFPEGYPLKLRLKDILEEVVDEKYYLSNKIIASFNKHKERNAQKGNGFGWNPTDGNVVANTLMATGTTRAEGNYIVEPQLHQVGQIYPNSGNPQAGRIYCADGISPAMDSCGGGNRMPKVVEPTIQKVDIPQMVKVRKYPVDVEKLCDTLRIHKEQCGWTNKELAEELERPLTTVEHWFRKDQYFAIPEPEVWEDLKWLLEMDGVDEFDESIMTFEEKEGIFEKSERYYFAEGIAPTLMSASAGNEKIITMVTEPMAYDEQNRYIRKNGCVGTLTTDGSSPKHNNLRIRKLTPKECFRLMGFGDKSFHKAEAVNSNTQLYKQAGNSIVVDVAEELLCMLFDEDGELYV